MSLHFHEICPDADILQLNARARFVAESFLVPVSPRLNSVQRPVC